MENSRGGIQKKNRENYTCVYIYKQIWTVWKNTSWDASYIKQITSSLNFSSFSS